MVLLAPWLGWQKRSGRSLNNVIRPAKLCIMQLVHAASLKLGAWCCLCGVTWLMFWYRCSENGKEVLVCEDCTVHFTVTLHSGSEHFFPVSSNNGFLKFSGEILLKFYLKISMSCRRLAVQNLPSIILLVTCLQKWGRDYTDILLTCWYV